MRDDSQLEMSLPGDHEIEFTRTFAAPRRAVFVALTDPDRMKGWLRPPGWEFSTCQIDLYVGGSYRYVWTNLEDGSNMGMGGRFTEVVKDVSFTATERFDKAWYPGEATVTTRLADTDGGTRLTVTIRYEDRPARDIALGSNMKSGLEASYAKLAEMLWT